jgi:hypothetical protein
MWVKVDDRQGARNITYLLPLLLRVLRFVEDGICAQETEGAHSSVSFKKQCWLCLEGICVIRSRVTEQARLLGLLLRVRSKSTKTGRILRLPPPKMFAGCCCGYRDCTKRDCWLS